MRLFEYKVDQSTDAWLKSRVGVLSASLISVARERDSKGRPTSACDTLAMELALQQLGYEPREIYTNRAMRIGKEQEPAAFAEYERKTMEFPETVGFIATENRLYGCSPDGLLPWSRGGTEFKTMVATENIINLWTKEDATPFYDQVMFSMWLLKYDFWDIGLFNHRRPKDKLKIIRVPRDDQYIARMRSDIDDFMILVDKYRNMDTPGSKRENLAPMPDGVELIEWRG